MLALLQGAFCIIFDFFSISFVLEAMNTKKPYRFTGRASALGALWGGIIGG